VPQVPFIPDFRSNNIGRYGRFGDAHEARLVNALERIWNIGGPGSSCGNFFTNALGGGAGIAALQVAIQNAQWSNAHSAVRPGSSGPARHRVTGDEWAAVQTLGSSPPLGPGDNAVRAWTVHNSDVSWLHSDVFRLLDDDQLATFLIHEMLHMGLPGVSGRGAEIDANYNANYQQISDACGTANPLR